MILVLSNSAPSKMLHAITPALPVMFSHPSKSVTAQSSSLAVTAVVLSDIDVITGMKVKSLSSTLQKLYLWEKKLLTEVKVSVVVCTFGNTLLEMRNRK